MKFYLYSEQLFTKKNKEFNGTAVMIVDNKVADLEARSVRCHTFFGDPDQYVRWKKMISHLGDGTGWAIIPQTEDELVRKIKGLAKELVRDKDWESKIEEYKVCPAQNKTPIKYSSFSMR